MTSLLRVAWYVGGVGMSHPEIDELLRASLVATTDAERAELGAAIGRVPDVIAQLGERLRSSEWETRRLALHFASRLARPPVELAPAVVSALASPLSREPFGEETVVGLVVAGLFAAHLTARRHAIEERLVWIRRAIEVGTDDAPRAEIVLRLALDTLAKIDAAIAAERAAYAQTVSLIAERFATTPGDAVAMVALRAAKDPERHAFAAALWKAIAYAFPDTSTKRREALEHALEALRWDASGATSGGEGLARMEVVHELEREIAALPGG